MFKLLYTISISVLINLVLINSVKAQTERELLINYPKISIEKTLELAKKSANEIEGIKFVDYCNSEKTIMLKISSECKFSDDEIAKKIMVEAYLGVSYTIRNSVSISQFQNSCAK